MEGKRGARGPQARRRAGGSLREPTLSRPPEYPERAESARASVLSGSGPETTGGHPAEPRGARFLILDPPNIRNGSNRPEEGFWRGLAPEVTPGPAGAPWLPWLREVRLLARAGHAAATSARFLRPAARLAALLWVEPPRRLPPLPAWPDSPAGRRMSRRGEGARPESRMR